MPEVSKVFWENETGIQGNFTLTYMVLVGTVSGMELRTQWMGPKT